MSRKNDYGKTAPLIAVVAIIAVAIIAVTVFTISNMGNTSTKPEAIITEAPLYDRAIEGTVGDEKYNGEKSPEGVLSYRINGEITVTNGEGDFYIANPPKNELLMVARFFLGDELIYESGYIFPNYYVKRDALSTTLSPGDYTLRVQFEGIKPDTLESAGVTEREIKLIVK